jgi:Protein of unknown function (DUF3551)
MNHHHKPRRNFMRKIALALTALATLAALPLTTVAARADGPWCAYYYKGGTNCGFYSYSQCADTISGIGGTCGRNPGYQGRSSRY